MFVEQLDRPAHHLRQAVPPASAQPAADPALVLREVEVGNIQVREE
jgi:hypothetical protein